VEFYYKNDALGDPLVTPDHIRLLQLATPEQVERLGSLALAINNHLQAFWRSCRLELVDFKLEFGLDEKGEILLADEISPDTCRLWDRGGSEPRVLDKDLFRFDLGIRWLAIKRCCSGCFRQWDPNSFSPRGRGARGEGL
jgi:phosphoribosylaminoimidazole-succinocarboxamide synthase